MEYVINCAFSDFEIPEEIVNNSTFSENNSWKNSEKVRTSPVLIDWVRKHPDSDLGVAIIPNDATDFLVATDNGFEEIYAVVNGKIIFVPPENQDGA